MICRNVSKTLRTEAEGDMARARIPTLTWIWSLIIDINVPSLNTTMFLGSIEKTGFANFSTNGDRVFFDVQLHGEWPSTRTGIAGRQLWPEDQRENTRDTVSDDHDDHYKLHQWTERWPYRLSCLGTSVHEIEIPGLDINWEAEQISFLWKPFLTDFFMEEAYVRSKRTKPSRPYRDGSVMADYQKPEGIKSQCRELKQLSYPSQPCYSNQKNLEMFRDAYIQRALATNSQAAPSLGLLGTVIACVRYAAAWCRKRLLASFRGEHLPAPKSGDYADWSHEDTPNETDGGASDGSLVGRS